MFEPGGSNERQDVLKRLQNPLEFAATDNLGVLGVLRAWPRWMARCEAVRMSPPDASVLARGLKLLTSRYIEAAPDANFRTAMLRTSLRLDGQPTMDNLYAYQRHLQAEVETLIASQPRAVPAAEQPRLRALDKPQSPKGKDKEKDKDKSTADLCRYFSMATLDREARNEKCLLCGSEGHRRRECTVGQSTPKAGTTTAPQQRGQRAIADKEPAAGVSTMSTTATAGSMDTASTASSIQGTPWTLEALVQAAQQVVATQGSPSREDRSPEKTKLEVRMKDIRISSMTTTSALLDSGATHSLRSARDMDEWDQASEVVVQLAGNDVLTMRMSDTGSLLMPPRSTPSPGGESSNQGQTIVPSASWSRLWAIRWRGLPRGNEHRRAAALEYQRWLPSAMRGRGSFANRKIGRQEEGAPRELYGGDNGQGVFGGYADGERLEEQIQEYVGTGSMEAGYRSVRDAAFLQDLPGECLDGLIQPNIREDGWKIMKAVDFLTRPQKRRLWTARRWVIHLFAGSPGHWQVFQLDQGSTVVLELDVHRCGGHDILSSPTWRLLLWGAITGRIDAVVGGPPGRGGLTGTKALRAITRMLWLYSVADVARGESKLNQKRPVAFMLEHPSQDSARRESLWTTQMWQQFQEEMDVPQVTFNPAAMGGETGSTTIGTNIYYLMGLQDLGVEGVEGESSQQGCKSPVWPPGFVDALVKALQFWDRRPICTPMLAKMSAEQWRRHVQSNHADYHRDCLTCVMAKGRGRRHARVHHPHMFTLTIDLAGPVKPGLDVSSKGALGKNLKYLLVARDVLPTEYVKGYTGTEPPGDHGLNKHGLEPENSAGKELARPSPLPPRDEGVLAEEELPVTAEKDASQELARPSLLPPHDEGGSNGEDRQVELEERNGEELARPSPLPPHDEGDPFIYDLFDPGDGSPLQHDPGDGSPHGNEPSEGELEGVLDFEIPGFIGGSAKQRGEFRDGEDVRVLNDMIAIMRVDDIKVGLRELGLPTSGVKVDVTNRLATAMSGSLRSTTSPTLRQCRYILWLWRHKDLSGRALLTWECIRTRVEISRTIHRWKSL